MIDIRANEVGGPGIFLTRLKREIDKMDISEFDSQDIVLSNEFISTGNVLVLRLDGINFLKMSPVEISNLLRYRSKKFHGLFRLNKTLSYILGKNYTKYITPALTKFFFERMNDSQIRGLHKAEFIIFQSQFSKDSWEHFTDDNLSQNFVIINNGVDIKQFSPHNEKFSSLPKGELNILASGNFRIHKRLHESLEVMRRLIEIIPTCKFFVLGRMDGQTKHVISTIITEYQSLQDNVVFLGHVNYDKLPLFYNSMDLFLHPAWLDPCPNVVVEALASGLPVVCPSTGGTCELVREGGIIIDEDFEFDFTEYYNVDKIPKLDYNKYIEAIIQIRDKREHYSNLARRQAEENLDIKKVAKKYVNVFQQIHQN